MHYFFWVLFIFICPNIYSLPLNFTATGIDQAQLSDEHIQIRDDFIKQKLKRNDKYDEDKIRRFIKEIKNQRDQFQSEIYETHMIEKLELDVKKWEKSHNKAKENSSIHSRYMIAFNQYLIPLLEDLRKKVQGGEKEKILDGIAADFIRGFLTFYTPNAYRTSWPFDIKMGLIVKRTVKPETFKKNSLKVEASNLIVEKENLSDLNNCLNKKVKLGDYLTSLQIEDLKKCSYDISTLNPGVSPLWKNPTKDEIEQIHIENIEKFPTPQQQVFFKKVILRGQGSPKFKVAYKKNDDTFETIKLKLANEVHVDKSLSKILELMGFNQDQMIYRDKVKMFLKDTTFEEFESLYANKYGPGGLQSFIHEKGGSGEHKYVIMKDVLFESKSSDELRLGPVDFGSWDLMNRREFRSFVLVLSWLGVVDTKLANFRYVLRKTNDSYIPLVRLQDLGYSLGPSIFLRKPRNFLSAGVAYTVNEFDTTFVKTNKNKSHIKLLWNDFGHRKRNTVSTTYSDLRWMARKIAKIRSRDIYKSFINSGMPEPVAKVFHLKLIHRRNHLVKSFELENEIPLYKVPKLKNYNPYKEQKNPPIKNGKVTQTVFEDKTNVVHLKQTWATLLTKLASFNIPIYQWEESKYASNTTSLLGLNSLQNDLGIALVPSSSFQSEIPLDFGIKAILTRKVQGNPQTININKKNNLFRITDEVTLQFDLNSSILDRILKKIKFIGGHLNISLFEKRYQYIHYTDQASKGFISSFRLHKVLKNLEDFAVYNIKELELIRSYSRVGIGAQAGIGTYLTKPFLTNEMSFFGNIHTRNSKYYYRDQYGQLHVYLDQLKSKNIGSNLDVLSAGFFGAILPFIKHQVGKNKFEVKTQNLYFELDKLEREHGKQQLSPSRLKKEYEALAYISKHEKSPETVDFVKSKFKFKSQGVSKKNAHGALWIFSSENQRNLSHFSLHRQNSGSKHYLRLNTSKRKSDGLEGFSLFLANSDVYMRSRKRVRVDTELNRDKPSKFIAMIRSEEFARTHNKKSLIKFINHLNDKYSEDYDRPLYRGYKLPRSRDINTYKQVYGLTRIFVNGEQLIKSLQGKSHKELSDQLKDYLRKPTSHRLHHFITLVRFKKILRSIHQISKELLKNQPEVIKLAKLYHEFLYNLKIEIYGLSFIKKILGENHIYVMSEIAGVHSSYSTTQDIQQPQRRRFTGMSWGTYHRTPPIQKLLRYNRPIRSSALIEKLMSDSTAMGFLEVGTAPNLYQTFDKSGIF